MKLRPLLRPLIRKSPCNMGKAIINNTTAVTGDAGALDMNGLDLATVGELHNANFCHVQYKYILVYLGITSADDDTAIKAFLNEKAGL